MTEWLGGEAMVRFPARPRWRMFGRAQRKGFSAWTLTAALFTGLALGITATVFSISRNEPGKSER